MKTAQLATMLEAGRLFRTDPSAKIDTGIWPQEVWDRAAFRRWFLTCLHNKINRGDERPWRKLTPAYQNDLAWDAGIINAAKRGMRHPGRNLLRTPEMKRAYPWIDTNLEE